MLEATVGFNYGPDNARVNAGDRVPEDFTSQKVAKKLLSRGVLVPVTEATAPVGEKTDQTPSPNTPDEPEAPTEAQGGGE